MFLLLLDNNNYLLNVSSTPLEGIECIGTKNYAAAVFTLIPLWILIAIMIMLLILTFHRNMRSIKVYDNCTKRNAHFVYFVELRTGECSETYNQRRTQLMIDLFDENQATLARLAIPGYLIYGRKDQLASHLDDDKFSELRVTRFWLYRAVRFKGISTIRITHNCLEPDARIMVFGLEIRSCEEDRYKTFFPIMSYISAYGPTNKPNTSFDVDSNGTISLIGGTKEDSNSISARLSALDHCLLIHITMSLCFLMGVADIYHNPTNSSVAAIYNGLLGGLIIFFVVLTISLVLRFIIKYYHALHMYSGVWAFAYYTIYAICLIISTVVWLNTTYYYYSRVCVIVYRPVTLSVIMSILESFTLLAVAYIIITLSLQIWGPASDRIVGAEDSIPINMSNSRKDRSVTDSKIRSMSKPQQQQQNYMPNTGATHSPAARSPFKSIGTAYTNQPNLPVHHQATSTPPAPGAIQPLTSYHTQLTTLGGPGQNTLKKTGSQESTGSNYYRHVMTNKGFIKSISQYGEALKQKKLAAAAKNDK